MTAVCPAGHTSSAEDYCDVCGMPIDAQASTADPDADQPPVAAPGGPAPDAAGADQQSCPNCGTPNALEALFCEACGYDFTTGSMPRPATPAGSAAAAPAAEETALLPSVESTGTTAAEQDTGAAGAGAAGDVSPSLPFSWVAELWIDPAWYEAQDSPDPLPSPGLPQVVPLRHSSVLVGRTSRSRNIHPEIDCGSDTGVSRRQAQLTSDGTRWFVEDLQSANGTFVGPASGELPTDPIPPGSKRELVPDDRVYVGAWTRLVIRPATEDEIAAVS